MTKKQEAAWLTENIAFKEAVQLTEEYYLNRIKQKPLEDQHAAMALSILDEIVSNLEMNANSSLS